MSFWAVARTRVHREPVAVRGLQEAGFEVFNPQTSRGASVFPGYIFVLVIDQWRAIDRTFGVYKLVKFGESPARCPDAQIAAMKNRIDPTTGFVHLPARPPELVRKKISIGQKVRIAGLEAVYQGMTVRERQRVLITLLGRQMVVEIRPGRKIDPIEPIPLAASARAR
jgi:transcription antitermination factor NusG